MDAAEDTSSKMDKAKTVSGSALEGNTATVRAFSQPALSVLRSRRVASVALRFGGKTAANARFQRHWACADLGREGAIFRPPQQNLWVTFDVLWGKVSSFQWFFEF